MKERQNAREGFTETFKPLIETSEKVKKSIDTQQNKVIEQLQNNQLALTEGFEGNRKAITSGFDKMDEVKRWDLQQLPDFEATLDAIKESEKENIIEELEKEGEGKDIIEKPKITTVTYGKNEIIKYLNEKNSVDLLNLYGLKLPSEYEDKSLEEFQEAFDKGLNETAKFKKSIKDVANYQKDSNTGLILAFPKAGKNAREKNKRTYQRTQYHANFY